MPERRGKEKGTELSTTRPVVPILPARNSYQRTGDKCLTMKAGAGDTF